MNRPDFPSPLTQVELKGKAGDHTVTLPRREVFRVENIFNDREYDIPQCFLPSAPLTVVDIGANVGLFALYMKMTQSISTLHCFEPAPASLELLKKNLGELENIHIHPYGLTKRNGTAPLMLHPRNSGQNSMAMAPAGGAGCIDVRIREASATFDHLGLTYIDVLKIDTEGCEVPILECLATRLAYIGIIMLEYHSENDRRHIDQLLSQFTLIGAKAEMMGVGTLKFINRRLLGKGRD